MIEVRSLTKRYGEHLAVDHLSFRLERGQTLALVGTSGCGKTTTLKMINRLIEPSGGSVRIEGQDAATLPVAQLRRRMGYVIQGIGLFPHYTVAANIGLGPRLQGWPAGRIRARVETLLERLRLPPQHFAHKFPHELSGGQQQRVGIARALAADPPIILMDEPFGALDPITRAEVRRDFRHLEELAGKTTILVTHDIEEAFELGDLVCILDHGRIQQFAPPRQVILQPANDFVRQFLGDKRRQLGLQFLRLKDLGAYLPVPGELATLPLLEVLDRLTPTGSGEALPQGLSLDRVFGAYRQLISK